MRFEEEPHCLASGVESRVGERAPREDRRVTSGDQERIAFAERNRELFGQVQDHFATGSGSAGFEKAEMACGNFRFAGQIELRQMSALTPFAEKIPDGTSRCHHGLTIA